MSCCVFSFHQSCVKMLCRRHNCNYLKVGDSIITVGVPGATTQRLHVRPCVGTLEGKWYNLRDCSAEKGVHFLGLCRLRGTRVCWLELLWESTKYENIAVGARESGAGHEK
jgi:hypothetical protein